ncbi:MAG: hypothetical protein ACJ0GN_04500 [Candidatus Actinomarina sp.]|nr:MAG: hypothetical protein CND04_02680 [Candidatus Actinomarinales bacterium MED-G02]|tara:strand:+ start:1141 stop:1428 length:288 start_codon:yes stop_codon:yes gene_type:complete
MESKYPTKINAEKNDLGINFSKSKKIDSYFSKNKYKWSDEISVGPVLNNTSVIYTESSRVKNLIELEEQKILIDIEKKAGVKLISIDVQILNNQQ